MITFSEFLKENRDGYLYHATYRVHKDSIAKHGLKTNNDHKNWEDSKKGRVYLAKNAEIAQSHAETSEDAPEKHYNSGIVVYRVKRSNLDPKKIKKDSNIRGEDGGTVEYHDNIHSKHLEIHSEHDT
jgi:hypothetical protein